MTELVTITLENEMDLTLAYKRSIITAGLLGLTVSTQTAFATAVSEVCREVIDKAVEGTATIGVAAEDGRFYMITRIDCRTDGTLETHNAGFDYARKLVPVLEISSSYNAMQILIKFGIPRATRIDQRKIASVKQKIRDDGPVSAYEQVKQRNAQLADLNLQQGLALEQATFLDKQKSEFLSVASHELNSPLTILRSYAEIALRVEGGKDARLNGYLTKLEQQSKKLVNLVRQLMDISKFETGDIAYDLKTLDAVKLVNDIASDISVAAKDHKITVECTGPAQVKADPLRIEQVLSNLIGNAIKYSEAGSSIVVRTNVTSEALKISVQDSGIGMSPETQQRMFQKFYRDDQIKMKYSGLGMGLYIASRIIKDHKGSFEVESEEGRGSTFSITLPLSN